ncbi:MAG: hypothetical protein WDW38_003543 [Sanguina aurantia]
MDENIPPHLRLAPALLPTQPTASKPLTLPTSAKPHPSPTQPTASKPLTLPTPAKPQPSPTQPTASKPLTPQPSPTLT